MVGVSMRRTPGLPFSPRARYAALALLLVAVPFALLVFLVRVSWGPMLRLDMDASTALHRAAVDQSWFVTAMLVVSRLGSTVVWFAVFAVVVGWLLWRRRFRLAAFAGLTVVTSSLLNDLVKAAVDRARPVLPDPVAHAPGLSFPSGHAQAAMVGCAVLLLVFLPVLPTVARRYAVGGAVFVVLAIGFSRVALGVHYVSDVVGGYVLGAAWVAAMVALFNAGPVGNAGPVER